MRFRKIVKLFEDGNVCVCGLRGRGKDMLLSNVVARRRIPYVSNVPYGGDFIPIDFKAINCGENTYNDFIKGTLKRYVYPYADGTDIYISDCGIYFPSQFCNELNRDYKHIPVFSALSRQLGACNVHVNIQNLNRCWDKLREMSDTYITCNRCIVLFRGRLVIQQVTIYDKYESCLNRLDPFKMSKPLTGEKINKTQIELEKQRFRCNHGIIKRRILIYKNKSTYDTRYFKTLLEG